MKPELRLAGIFASATFLVIGVRSYVLTWDPIHAMIFGLGSSLLMGVIGYKIAEITTHPKGKRKPKGPRSGGAGSRINTSHLTGEETFLDDLGS